MPRQGDLPLPSLPNPHQLGHRNCKPTCLEALTARVPSDSPCMDVTTIPPWEDPIWRTCLKLWGVVNLHTTWSDWTQDLHRSLKGLNIAAIHVIAVLTNEGCKDNKVVGAVGATMVCGSQWGAQPEWSWTHGEMIKQFNVNCFGLAKTVEVLTL
jgi:hypothetical protein